MVNLATSEAPLEYAAPKACLLPRPRVSALEVAGLAVGALLLLFSAFQVFAFVHDDAFITYRYSYNLLYGAGFVFNPGERTEGYSCPLYMLLTTLLMLLPGDVLIRAKLLGILFALGAIWAAWRLAGELDLPRWARAAVPVMLGANSSLALSAVDGMETSFQMLLVTMAALSFVRERKSGRGVGSALWLLAAALDRPEGLLFFLFALAPFALGIRARGFARRDAAWLAALLAPFALFLLWRLSYYGDPLPNTYYAKNVGWDVVFEKGPPYLLRTLFVNLDERIAVAAVSGLLWVLALGGAATDRVRRSGGLVIPLFVLAQAVFALRTSGDWMQGWRYMMAVMPLWTLLIAAGLSEPAEALAKWKGLRAGAALYGSCVGLFIAACLWASTEFRSEKDGMVSWAGQGWATDSRGLLQGYRMQNTLTSAEFLNKAVPPGATIAFSEMGATPYYTPGLRWLDTYGLTDRTIAHMGSLARYRTGVTGDYTDASTDLGRHIVERRPDFVMRWVRSSGSSPAILGGAYVPYATAPLHDFDSPSGESGDPVALQLWKRAN